MPYALRRISANICVKSISIKEQSNPAELFIHFKLTINTYFVANRAEVNLTSERAHQELLRGGRTPIVFSAVQKPSGPTFSITTLIR